MESSLVQRKIISKILLLSIPDFCWMFPSHFSFCFGCWIWNSSFSNFSTFQLSRFSNSWSFHSLPLSLVFSFLFSWLTRVLHFPASLFSSEFSFYRFISSWIFLLILTWLSIIFHHQLFILQSHYRILAPLLFELFHNCSQTCFEFRWIIPLGD